MPTFNEITVRQLISNIDSFPNSSLLRVGYFASHRKAPYPTSKGETLIDEALIVEQEGTFRWFLLQMVRGVAAFHAPDVDVDEGFDAYRLIFDNVNLAITSQTQAAVRTSVRDFATSIDTSLKRKAYPGDPRVADLLLKAWNVWNTLPPSAIDAKRPMDWSRAIKAANAQGKFTAIVEDALKDTAHPPDFAMLKMAVVVLQDKEPKRAIDLLKTAQKKLQPDDVSNQKWLYQTWTQLLTGNAPQEQQGMKVTDKVQLAQLAEMRKDQISYTGGGYADLLKLYWQLGENDKAAELIKVMNESGINAEEKINVAGALLHPPVDIVFSKDAVKQLQGQGVELLQKYLSSLQEIPLNPPLTRGTFDKSAISPGGTLEIRNELHARYLLGLYFMRQDMVTEEGKALQTGDLKPPFHDSQSAAYYDQILQLRAALEKKLKGVEGVR